MSKRYRNGDQIKVYIATIKDGVVQSRVEMTGVVRTKVAHLGTLISVEGSGGYRYYVTPRVIDKLPDTIIPEDVSLYASSPSSLDSLCEQFRLEADKALECEIKKLSGTISHMELMRSRLGTK
jgi:hypothetical protein